MLFVSPVVDYCSFWFGSPLKQHYMGNNYHFIGNQKPKDNQLKNDLLYSFVLCLLAFRSLTYCHWFWSLLIKDSIGKRICVWRYSPKFDSFRFNHFFSYPSQSGSLYEMDSIYLIHLRKSWNSEFHRTKRIESNKKCKCSSNSKRFGIL